MRPKSPPPRHFPEKSALQHHSHVLLVWAKLQPSCFSPLSFNIIREVCSYLHHVCLVCVTANSVKFIDIERLEHLKTIPIRALTTQVQVNSSSRWTVMDEARVVVCGGGETEGEAWKSAYILNRRGGVKELPEMLFGHSCAGLIMWRAAVHIFGSVLRNGERRAECLRLSASKWEMLPSMQEQRTCFTPVEWRNLLYLCGGVYTESIEIFDGTDMKVIGVKLPVGGVTAAYVFDGKLMVLTEYQINVISKENDSEELIQTEIREFSPVSAYTNPVVWEGKVYCADQTALYSYWPEDGRKVE